MRLAFAGKNDSVFQQNLLESCMGTFTAFISRSAFLLYVFQTGNAESSPHM